MLACRATEIKLQRENEWYTAPGSLWPLPGPLKSWHGQSARAGINHWLCHMMQWKLWAYCSFQYTLHLLWPMLDIFPLTQLDRRTKSFSQFLKEDQIETKWLNGTITSQISQKEKKLWRHGKYICWYGSQILRNDGYFSLTDTVYSWQCEKLLFVISFQTSEGREMKRGNAQLLPSQKTLRNEERWTGLSKHQGERGRASLWCGDWQTCFSTRKIAQMRLWTWETAQTVASRTELIWAIRW